MRLREFARNRFPRSRERSIATATAAAVIVGIAMVPAAVWAEADVASTGRLSAWHPCAEDPTNGEVECAELTVPVDWSRPDGEEVRLDVKRQLVANSAMRVGALMVGPGGPGQSGTVIVTDGYLPDSLREAFDIVGYDSRGVGARRAQCDPAPIVYPLPRNELEFNTLLAENKRYGESCRTAPVSLMNHLDAASDARDMEALRSALGEEKLNYYGASYGALRGQTYATLFPQRVGRMVLDGNVDHSLSDAHAFMSTTTEAAEENLNLFFAWCDTHVECSIHLGPKQTFTKVYAKAQEADRASPGHVYNLVNEATIGAANGERSWPELADELARRSEATVLPSSDRTLNGPAQAIFCSD